MAAKQTKQAYARARGRPGGNVNEASSHSLASAHFENGVVHPKVATYFA
jgi:hypothetical protein